MEIKMASEWNSMGGGIGRWPWDHEISCWIEIWWIEEDLEGVGGIVFDERDGASPDMEGVSILHLDSKRQEKALGRYLC
jgi:hypothetical protein